MSPFCCELRHALLLAGLITCSVAASAITGSVVLDPSQETRGAMLRVWVHAQDGSLVESSAVALDGSFLLHSLPAETDGIYILHLNGAIIDEYVPLLVVLRSGGVASVLPRKEPLMVPPRPGSSAWPDSTELKFVPLRKANYAKKRAPWRLRDLWRYKFRILQLMAVVFVVWFPQFIRELPKELREELMGEEEVDSGDPNALVKTLLGRGDPKPDTTLN